VKRDKNRKAEKNSVRQLQGCIEVDGMGDEKFSNQRKVQTFKKWNRKQRVERIMKENRPWFLFILHLLYSSKRQ